MKSRPTISLCLIAKNEAHNVPRLFQSIEGCFDEIIFTDTGSTDGTIEVAKDWAEKINTPIKIEHFTWINDFAAARNYSFSKASCQYSAWLDLDDALYNKEAFIQFRDHAMEHCGYWLVPYDYALKPDGSAAITFSRERIVKTGATKWQYFIHEGIVPFGPVDAISTWRVQHHRTEADQKADRSRNIKIIEDRITELDSRLTFYYGKELYENNQQEKALKVLIDVATKQDLEIHDRILAIQYACYSAMSEADKRKPEFQEQLLLTAISLAHQGLQLAPLRAEYWHVLGECLCKMNKLNEALPMFAAAEHCKNTNPAGSNHVAAIFNFDPLYSEIPIIQKARIYFNTGNLDAAEIESKKAVDKFNSVEGKQIYDEIQRIRPLITLTTDKKDTNDIVFTTPPQTAYPFDENIYLQKGLGGSETALVHMAKYLKQHTKYNVKVFNMRDRDEVMPSGVEYISNSKLNEYMSANNPKVHIAWRHNIKLTNAPTYLWCHDLVTLGCDVVHNFDYMMCLTEFHKNYVMARQGVPVEKIITTRNGIEPYKFDFPKPVKNPNKLVWMSSPDRGLERAIVVAERLKKKFPDIELHVYYGLENLYKYGLGEMADRFKAAMAQRPWIKYHGFTEQSKMYRDVADAAIWLHPCNFIETFCITALEMLSLGIYPVTRRLGALKDTLKDAESKGMATLLDHDCITDQEIEAYEKATEKAIIEQKWNGISFDPTTFSWESVAKDWIRFLPIEQSEQ